MHKPPSLCIGIFQTAEATLSDGGLDSSLDIRTCKPLLKSGAKDNVQTADELKFFMLSIMLHQKVAGFHFCVLMLSLS